MRIGYTPRMESPVHNTPSLYRGTLGEAFDSLPTVLRHFHDHPHDARARGSLRVTRGTGWLRQAMAAAMRLPSPGEQVPVLLHVQANAEEERWTRDFGTLRLVTRQWRRNGLLIEAAGPLRFGFHLTANPEEMRFEFARCWLMGIPLPLFLSPRVNAWVSEYEEGWWARVRVEAPLLGLLTQYEGKVTPQC